MNLFKFLGFFPQPFGKLHLHCRCTECISLVSEGTLRLKSQNIQVTSDHRQTESII